MKEVVHMDNELITLWKQEEEIAHIQGWDFSHIHNRYEEENDLPWDYASLIHQYLADDKDILDYDTGEGEFLLSLHHPFQHTYATEGYLPNVILCQKKLLPLGIHFKECHDPSHIPFKDESFDMIINRHGDFDAHEIYRLLKKDGIFITQQVGEDNDRDLVEMVLPDVEKPYPHMNLKEQKELFEVAGFTILQAQEAYRPILFYDVGAFVWFAHIIEWEFPGFSVDSCLGGLMKMQQFIENNGYIRGTIHRYLIVARKK